MNTLPPDVQARFNEYDEYVRTHYGAGNKITRVYETTPTGEVTVRHIQRKTFAPSMSFREYVERIFIPKTPFTKRPFILRENCDWKNMYVSMAKRAFHYTCMCEDVMIEWIKNPRKDGTVDEEIHQTGPVLKRKTLREKVAEEKFNRLYAAVLRREEEEARADEDFNW